MNNELLGPFSPLIQLLLFFLPIFCTQIIFVLKQPYSEAKK